MTATMWAARGDQEKQFFNNQQKIMQELVHVDDNQSQSQTSYIGMESQINDIHSVQADHEKRILKLELRRR